MYNILTIINHEIIFIFHQRLKKSVELKHFSDNNTTAIMLSCEIFVPGQRVCFCFGRQTQHSAVFDRQQLADCRSAMFTKGKRRQSKQTTAASSHGQYCVLAVFWKEGPQQHTHDIVHLFRKLSCRTRCLLQIIRRHQQKS